MMNGVKQAWHTYIGDAPLDDDYRMKMCAFLEGWEACVAKNFRTEMDYDPSAGRKDPQDEHNA